MKQSTPFTSRSGPLSARFVRGSGEGPLGVMGEAGEANMQLQKTIDAGSRGGGGSRAVDAVSLDPNDMLPDELEVFRYLESLTSPTCTEARNGMLRRTL